ncbi:MAG: glycosyltransferase [Pseudomonadota bacterium]
MARPTWQKFLLFAPALMFDTVRYYLSNTIIFFIDIFRGGASYEDGGPDFYPFVSIILPAYNEGPRIRGTINSLLASDYKNFEIIVVDDCSTDTTPAICREFERRGLIKFIRKEIRGGKPSSLNYGFQFTKGELIFHFDAEVAVLPNTISEAIKPFKDPKIGAVSGNLKVHNDKKSLASRLQAAEYGMVISLQRRWLSATRTLQIASGAFGVFRREAIEMSKGADPEHGDDLDITLKVKKLGYRVVFAPRAIALTNVPESFWVLFQQRVRWDKCYVRISFRKHRNISDISKFRFADFLIYVLDIVFNLLLMLVFPIYIVLVAIFVPHLFLFIIVITYLFYVIMNMWQFIMVVLLSDTRSRDWVFVLYAPLYFAYSVFLWVARMLAYTIELLRLKFMKSGFLPEKIWDSMPKY